MLDPGPETHWVFYTIIVAKVWTGLVCKQKKHNNTEISVKTWVKNWIYRDSWGKTELSAQPLTDLGFQLLTLLLGLAQWDSTPDCAI